MFEIGEYIVYGVKGVCRIEDITHIDISGADKDRLYYVPVSYTHLDVYKRQYFIWFASCEIGCNRL